MASGNRQPPRGCAPNAGPGKRDWRTPIPHLSLPGRKARWGLNVFRTGKPQTFNPQHPINWRCQVCQQDGSKLDNLTRTGSDTFHFQIGLLLENGNTTKKWPARRAINVKLHTALRTFAAKIRLAWVGGACAGKDEVVSVDACGCVASGCKRASG